ncbi:ankyrin-3-like isoform X1 [Pomacea canaliculata]|uniref:ankyrin-3-like isoform X1 n=1 Tax=Pomacea canaliculata TaxID=400727 RepID=UPI000D73002E|nr:ankyrin-3-like isoform X1 [Pomacea canaliculata]XP_025115856.1 ankyrin-3-like isoform X1 [Pomacea canaliculata]XP_025115857.1 ankyrin-3-like isoform X1 [Pomacea canaliculata]
MSWQCVGMAMDTDAQFLRAVRGGNLEEVRKYLDAGQNVDTTNINGMSGLHLAAKEGHLSVVMELLNRGANCAARTRKNNTPLHVAALARQSQVTQILLERGADINAVSETGFTPLYLAAQENGSDIACMLLQAGADQRIHTVDGFSPLAVAVQQENAEVINVLLPNWRASAPEYAFRLLEELGLDCPDVFRYTAEGNFVELRKAIRSGSDVNQTLKDGLSPLHLAVVLGDLQMVKELISHGAFPSTISEKLSSPLITACHSCRRDIIQALLSAGANPNDKPRPYSPLLPLHIACNYGDTAAVLMLLQHGADVKAAGKWISMNARVAFDDHHAEVMSLLVQWALQLCPEQQTHVMHDTESEAGNMLLEPPTPYEPDPDPAGTCLAMMRSLFRSRPEHVDELIEAALSTIHQCNIFKAADEGNAVLATACLDENPACLETKTKCGLTPLHVACVRGHVAVVSLFLERKANPNASTDNGITPTIMAAYANCPSVLQLLMKNGADMTLSMQNGLTPLGMAIAKKNLEAAENILKQHPLAPCCSILNVLSTQSEEQQVSQVLGMVEWACRSNPLSSANRRKKGRRACVLT